MKPTKDNWRRRLRSWWLRRRIPREFHADILEICALYEEKVRLLTEYIQMELEGACNRKLIHRRSKRTAEIHRRLRANFDRYVDDKRAEYRRMDRDHAIAVDKVRADGKALCELIRRHVNLDVGRVSGQNCLRITTMLDERMFMMLRPDDPARYVEVLVRQVCRELERELSVEKIRCALASDGRRPRHTVVSPGDLYEDVNAAGERRWRGM